MLLFSWFLVFTAAAATVISGVFLGLSYFGNLGVYHEAIVFGFGGMGLAALLILVGLFVIIEESNPPTVRG